MNTQGAIRSQYLAALKMLKEAIVKCPPMVWDTPKDKDRFWYKAHHALYWTQVDLRASLGGYIPWSGRRKPDTRTPSSKDELLAFLAFIERQVIGRYPADAGAVSARGRGFHLENIERLISSIRHIQQHTGELYERLGSRQNISLRWTEHVHRKVA